MDASHDERVVKAGLDRWRERALTREEEKKSILQTMPESWTGTVVNGYAMAAAAAAAATVNAHVYRGRE